MPLPPLARLSGEPHGAADPSLAPDDKPLSLNFQRAELGAVLAGTASGRRAAEDITLCDLTGTGVQDTAIANLALIRARHAGAGQRFAS